MTGRMHLCDQRVVTLASLGAGTAEPKTVRWSTDGRYLSLSWGDTYETTAPTRVVLADLTRGVIADVLSPWGYVRMWSPGNEIAVLWRYGFHGPAVRLARIRLA